MDNSFLHFLTYKYPNKHLYFAKYYLYLNLVNSYLKLTFLLVEYFSFYKMFLLIEELHLKPLLLIPMDYF